MGTLRPSPEPQTVVSERLCLLSSGLWSPRLAITHHGIQDRKELAHRGGHRDFRQMAIGTQALIEGADHGIAPNCRHRRHVENPPHGWPPAGDHAASTELAA